MKTATRMTIEQNTFDQVLALPPGDLMELLNTVCLAAVFSRNLDLKIDLKTQIACDMMHYAYSILEQCGNTVSTTIDNPNLAVPIKYKDRKWQ